MPPPSPSAPCRSIETIIVPTSSLASLYPDELPAAVSRFVDCALTQAEYIPAELPGQALIAHDLFLYHGEVQNGGHAQFVGNVGHDQDAWSLITVGLSLLRLPEAKSIFADLQAFATAYPERIARCFGEFDEIDPYFFELDDRFSAQSSKQVITALADWLKTRPWISTVSDDAYRASVAQLVPPHPLSEARRERRRPAALAQIAEVFPKAKRTVH